MDRGPGAKGRFAPSVKTTASHLVCPPNGGEKSKSKHTQNNADST